MAHPLTSIQLALLARASSSPLAVATLRDHSELRWLEHLGLVAADASGRFSIAAKGRARLLDHGGTAAAPIE